MKKYFIYCLIITSVIIKAQMPNEFLLKKLSREQLRNDLCYLKKNLRKFHPTFYEYTSKEKMANFYDSIIKIIPDSLNELEFRKYVSYCVNMVKCGHMSVTGSKKYISESKNINQKFIPIKVKILDNKIYVLECFDSVRKISEGTEILKINSINADKIISDLQKLVSTDADNTTHKLYYAEKNFCKYFALTYGFYEKFEVVLKNGTIDTLTAQIYLPIKTKETKDFKTLLLNFANCKLYTLDSVKKVFVLDIENFSGKKKRKFFRKTFKILKQNKAEHLVIDMRDNGGGNMFAGNMLLSYLLKQPVIPFTISRKPNLASFNPKLKGGFLEKITPFLFMTNPLQFPNKRGWNHTFLTFKHYRNHYRKKIYVLTNGATFSMASYVTSYLKHKANAITIGQETGGSEYGSRPSPTGILVLPNSKVRVVFNLYHQSMVIKIKDSRHGILPEYKIDYTIEDILNKKDLEIEKVNELIQKK